MDITIRVFLSSIMRFPNGNMQSNQYLAITTTAPLPISSTLHKPGLPSKLPRSAPFQVVPTLTEEHGGLKGRGYDQDIVENEVYYDGRYT